MDTKNNTTSVRVFSRSPSPLNNEGKDVDKITNLRSGMTDDHTTLIIEAIEKLAKKHNTVNSRSCSSSQDPILNSHTDDKQYVPVNHRKASFYVMIFFILWIPILVIIQAPLLMILIVVIVTLILGCYCCIQYNKA